TGSLSYINKWHNAGAGPLSSFGDEMLAMKSFFRTLGVNSSVAVPMYGASYYVRNDPNGLFSGMSPTNRDMLADVLKVGSVLVLTRGLGARQKDDSLGIAALWKGRGIELRALAPKMVRSLVSKSGLYWTGTGIWVFGKEGIPLVSDIPYFGDGLKWVGGKTDNLQGWLAEKIVTPVLGVNVSKEEFHTYSSLALVGWGLLRPGFKNIDSIYSEAVGKVPPKILLYRVASQTAHMMPSVTIMTGFIPTIQDLIARHPHNAVSRFLGKWVFDSVSLSQLRSDVIAGLQKQLQVPGVNKQEIEKRITEIQGMSDSKFRLFMSLSTSANSVEEAFKFGVSMYFIGPLLHPGLMKVPIMGSLQEFMSVKMGDRLVGAGTIPVLRNTAKKGVTSRLLGLLGRGQDFVFEEYFREMVSTRFFIQPVFMAAGLTRTSLFGTEETKKTGEIPSIATEEGQKKRARLEGFMEWFQEAFDNWRGGKYSAKFVDPTTMYDWVSKNNYEGSGNLVSRLRQAVNKQEQIFWNPAANGGAGAFEAASQADADDYMQMLQDKGWIDALGRRTFDGMKVLRTGQQLQSFGMAPVFAADGARGMSQAQAQQAVDNRVQELTQSGTTPVVWGRTTDGQRIANRQEYQQAVAAGRKIDYVHFEYTDPRAAQTLGRNGLGYTGIGRNGERVTVLVYNGDKRVRLHELGEMRVTRQQQLMQAGRLMPSSHVMRDTLRTMAAHDVVDSVLGYKGQWKPDVRVSGNPIEGSGSLEIPHGDPSVVEIVNHGSMAAQGNSFVDPSLVRVNNRGRIISEGNSRIINSKVDIEVDEGETLVLGGSEDVVNQDLRIVAGFASDGAVDQQGGAGAVELPQVEAPTIRSAAAVAQEAFGKQRQKVQEGIHALENRLLGRGEQQSGGLRKEIARRREVLRSYDDFISGIDEQSAGMHMVEWAMAHPEFFDTEVQEAVRFKPEDFKGVKPSEIRESKLLDITASGLGHGPLSRKEKNKLASFVSQRSESSSWWKRLSRSVQDESHATAVAKRFFAMASGSRGISQELALDLIDTFEQRLGKTQADALRARVQSVRGYSQKELLGIIRPIQQLMLDDARDSVDTRALTLDGKPMDLPNVMIVDGDTLRDDRGTKVSAQAQRDGIKVSDEMGHMYPVGDDGRTVIKHDLVTVFNLWLGKHEFYHPFLAQLANEQGFVDLAKVEKLPDGMRQRVKGMLQKISALSGVPIEQLDMSQKERDTNELLDRVLSTMDTLEAINSDPSLIKMDGSEYADRPEYGGFFRYLHSSLPQRWWESAYNRLLGGKLGEYTPRVKSLVRRASRLSDEEFLESIYRNDPGFKQNIKRGVATSAFSNADTLLDELLRQVRQGKVDMVELSEEEAWAKGQQDAAVYTRFTANGTEKPGDRRFFLVEGLPVGKKIVAIAHDGTHKLIDVREDREVGFLEKEYAEFTALVRSKGTQSLQQYLNIIALLKMNAYDNRLRDLVQGTLETLTGKRQDLPAEKFASHLKNIIGVIISPDRSRHLSQEDNEEVVATMQSIIAQIESGAVEVDEVFLQEMLQKIEDGDSAYQMSKTTFGVAQEIMGDVAPAIFLRDARQTAYSTGLISREAALLSEELFNPRNSEILDWLEQFYENIGWDLRVLRTRIPAQAFSSPLTNDGVLPEIAPRAPPQGPVASSPSTSRIAKIATAATAFLMYSLPARAFEFIANPDGSARYIVEKGDTYGHIALDWLKRMGEKALGADGRFSWPKQIQPAIDKIQELNPGEVANIDLIMPDQQLDVINAAEKIVTTPTVPAAPAQTVADAAVNNAPVLDPSSIMYPPSPLETPGANTPSLGADPSVAFNTGVTPTDVAANTGSLSSSNTPWETFKDNVDRIATDAMQWAGNHPNATLAIGVVLAVAAAGALAYYLYRRAKAHPAIVARQPKEVVGGGAEAPAAVVEPAVIPAPAEPVTPAIEPAASEVIDIQAQDTDAEAAAKIAQAIVAQRQQIAKEAAEELADQEAMQQALVAEHETLLRKAPVAARQALERIQQATSREQVINAHKAATDAVHGKLGQGLSKKEKENLLNVISRARDTALLRIRAKAEGVLTPAQEAARNKVIYQVIDIARALQAAETAADIKELGDLQKQANDLIEQAYSEGKIDAATKKTLLDLVRKEKREKQETLEQQAKASKATAPQEAIAIPEVNVVAPQEDTEGQARLAKAQEKRAKKAADVEEKERAAQEAQAAAEKADQQLNLKADQRDDVAKAVKQLHMINPAVVNDDNRQQLINETEELYSQALQVIAQAQALSGDEKDLLAREAWDAKEQAMQRINKVTTRYVSQPREEDTATVSTGSGNGGVSATQIRKAIKGLASLDAAALEKEKERIQGIIFASDLPDDDVRLKLADQLDRAVEVARQNIAQQEQEKARQAQEEADALKQKQEQAARDEARLAKEIAREERQQQREEQALEQLEGDIEREDNPLLGRLPENQGEALKALRDSLAHPEPVAPPVAPAVVAPEPAAPIVTPAPAPARQEPVSTSQELSDELVDALIKEANRKSKAQPVVETPQVAQPIKQTYIQKVRGAWDRFFGRRKASSSDSSGNQASSPVTDDSSALLAKLQDTYSREPEIRQAKIDTAEDFMQQAKDLERVLRQRDELLSQITTLTVPLAVRRQVGDVLQNAFASIAAARDKGDLHAIAVIGTQTTEQLYQWRKDRTNLARAILVSSLTEGGELRDIDIGGNKTGPISSLLELFMSTQEQAILNKTQASIDVYVVALERALNVVNMSNALPVMAVGDYLTLDAQALGLLEQAGEKDQLPQETMPSMPALPLNSSANGSNGVGSNGTGTGTGSSPAGNGNGIGGNLRIEQIKPPLDLNVGAVVGGLFSIKNMLLNVLHYGSTATGGPSVRGPGGVNMAAANLPFAGRGSRQAGEKAIADTASSAITGAGSEPSKIVAEVNQKSKGAQGTTGNASTSEQGLPAEHNAGRGVGSLYIGKGKTGGAQGASIEVPQEIIAPNKFGALVTNRLHITAVSPVETIGARGPPAKASRVSSPISFKEFVQFTNFPLYTISRISHAIARAIFSTPEERALNREIKLLKASFGKVDEDAIRQRRAAIVAAEKIKDSKKNSSSPILINKGVRQQPSSRDLTPVVGALITSILTISNTLGRAALALLQGLTPSLMARNLFTELQNPSVAGRFAAHKKGSVVRALLQGTDPSSRGPSYTTINESRGASWLNLIYQKLNLIISLNSAKIRPYLQQPARTAMAICASSSTLRQMAMSIRAMAAPKAGKNSLAMMLASSPIRFAQRATTTSQSTRSTEATTNEVASSPLGETLFAGSADPVIQREEFIAKFLAIMITHINELMPLQVVMEEGSQELAERMNALFTSLRANTFQNLSDRVEAILEEVNLEVPREDLEEIMVENVLSLLNAAGRALSRKQYKEFHNTLERMRVIRRAADARREYVVMEVLEITESFVGDLPHSVVEYGNLLQALAAAKAVAYPYNEERMVGEVRRIAQRYNLSDGQEVILYEASMLEVPRLVESRLRNQEGSSPIDQRNLGAAVTTVSRVSSPIDALTSVQFRDEIIPQLITRDTSDLNRPLMRLLKEAYPLQLRPKDSLTIEEQAQLVALTEDIDQLINVVNADPRFTPHIGEGKALAVEQTPNLEYYRQQARELVRQGRVAFLLLFGGMATRLGLGSMYPIDLVEVTKFLLNMDNTLSYAEGKRIQEAFGEFLVPLKERVEQQLGSDAVDRLIEDRAAGFREKIRIPFNEHRSGFKSRTMGQRHNLAFAQAIRELFSDEILQLTPTIVVPNHSIIDQTIDDYLKNKLRYGLGRSTFFMDAPLCWPYDLVEVASGRDKRIVAVTNQAVPPALKASPNHSYVMYQLGFRGEAYTISDGERSYVHDPLISNLANHQVDLFVTRRINDLELWDTNPETVLSIDQIAAALYLREQGAQMISEVLINDGKQKGGLLLRAPGMHEDDSYLFEGLSGQTRLWQSAITSANEAVNVATNGERRGVFYNRFNQIMFTKALQEQIFSVDPRDLGIATKVRLRPGGLQLETPFGEFSYVMRHRGIYREGALIKDCKAFNNLTLALEMAGYQDAASSPIREQKAVGALVVARTSSSPISEQERNSINKALSSLNSEIEGIDFHHLAAFIGSLYDRIINADNPQPLQRRDLILRQVGHLWVEDFGLPTLFFMSWEAPELVAQLINITYFAEGRLRETGGDAILRYIADWRSDDVPPPSGEITPFRKKSSSPTSSDYSWVQDLDQIAYSNAMRLFGFDQETVNRLLEIDVRFVRGPPEVGVAKFTDAEGITYITVPQLALLDESRDAVRSIVAEILASTPRNKFINIPLGILSFIGVSMFVIARATLVPESGEISDFIRTVIYSTELAFNVSFGYFLWVTYPLYAYLIKFIDTKIPGNNRHLNFSAFMMFATLAGVFEAEASMGGGLEMPVLFAVVMLNITKLIEGVKAGVSSFKQSLFFNPVVAGAALTVIAFLNYSIIHGYVKPMKDSFVAQLVANQFNDFLAVPLFIIATPFFMVLGQALMHAVKVVAQNIRSDDPADQRLYVDYNANATRIYGSNKAMALAGAFWATWLTVQCEVLGITSTPDFWDAVSYYAGGFIFVLAMYLCAGQISVSSQARYNEQRDSSSSPVGAVVRGLSRFWSVAVRSIIATIGRSWVIVKARQIAMEADRMEAQDALALGIGLAELKRFDDALRAFDESLRIVPTARAYREKGATLMLMGNGGTDGDIYRAAIDAFTQSLALDSMGAVSFINRGNCWHQLSQHARHAK
ncbi:MAG: hypothetical protein KBA46_02805, partial [Candidatus Omnitrophica bacterium]|nr:hypothetical protein [Candidatus Omnitrophota bacterium]